LITNAIYPKGRTKVGKKSEFRFALFKVFCRKEPSFWKKRMIPFGDLPSPLGISHPQRGYPIPKGDIPSPSEIPQKKERLCLSFQVVFLFKPFFRKELQMGKKRKLCFPFSILYEMGKKKLFRAFSQKIMGKKRKRSFPFSKLIFTRAWVSLFCKFSNYFLYCTGVAWLLSVRGV